MTVQTSRQNIFSSLKTLTWHGLLIVISVMLLKLNWASAQEVQSVKINSAESVLQKEQVLQERVQYYQQKYQLNDLYQKLVDNTGEGYDTLYGVRNLRMVLPGILYRGGANNYYNKNKKRDNMNPLPNEGLTNLCKEDFKGSVYLYTTRFSTAPKETRCQTTAGQKNQLNYQQITAFDEGNARKFLDMIYAVIKNPTSGPLYVHCWNGWHASGLVSTLALRQFCGLSAQEGLAYWTQNTDGHSKGYDSVKKRILDFVPYKDLQLTTVEKSILCPR